MKVFINPNLWKDSYDIYITEEGANRKRYIVKPMKLELEEFNEFEPREPSLTISRMLGKETNFLQELSDALSKIGYEPKTVEENKGELKATKIHLEDMRKLVFYKKENQ